MDVLEAVKAKALRAVLQPDGEYHGRYVRRWYSRTFHTPLHIVEDLPMLDLFEHFYECQYEEMDPEKRKNALDIILETEEQRKHRMLEEDASDAGAQELLEMAKQENKKLELEASKKPAPLPEIPAMRESELPNRPIHAAVPPDIKLTFIEEQSLLEEIEGLGSMIPPPKPKV